MTNSVLQVAKIIIACFFLLGGAVQVSTAQEATPAGNCPVTTEEENTALAERWFAAWDTGDSAAFEELLADGYEHSWALGQDSTGVDEFKDRMEQMAGALSEPETTIDAVHADGDLLTVRWTATATHSGSLLGAEPTGETVTWSGINVFRIECGQIAESWTEMDTFGILLQVGVPNIPATPAT